jgi:RNA polymerase sigma factor (sigma-70 family)
MEVTVGSTVVMGPTKMANGQPASALRHLRTIFSVGTTTGLADSQLLERFADKRAASAEAARAAETAFEALVNRHGPMVWGVCRRILGDAHEAEDAFQATFLILVRKAGSLRLDGSLGRWLYGVAHRVAARARFEARRRASLARPVPVTESLDPAAEVEQSDLRRVFGDELDRLPTKYRYPIELCQLQGLTYDQAARQLDWPVATVKSRLARGRLSLRQRLALRGLAPLAAGVATALASESRAAVPRMLLHSVVRAATSCAAGVVPAAVTDLSTGVLRMVMWQKLKLAAVTHNLHDVSVRLVAVRGDGEEFPAEIRSSAGVKEFMQIQGEFELPPDQIREFRVQTRPYEAVEIPGIALNRAGS